MSDELLPCPFCGSPADPEGWSSIDRKGPACTNPKCSSSADSADAWNRRSASTPAKAVSVKGLEWVKHPTAEAWRAETMLGSYKVFAVALRATWTFYGHAGELIERRTPDVDEAKAAAEADYHQRILSALEDAPQQEPVAWESVDAEGNTYLTKNKDIAAGWDRDDIFVRPLYALSHPSTPATGSKE